MAADIVVANTTASLDHDGRTVMLRRGVTTASADHPIVQAHPEMFSPMRVHFPVEEAAKPPAKVTETASAEPGERRSVRPSVQRKTTK